MILLARFCILFLVFALPLYGQIHVIMTSALINTQYEWRKAEYLNAVNAIKSYGFDPWILEATHITSSFFDAISGRVLYTQVNDLSCQRKVKMSLFSAKLKCPFFGGRFFKKRG